MTRTILVVDDDEGLRYSVRRVLEGAGYGVMEAGSIAEARALIDQISPDLVIMDLILPGMEGREGASLIHTREPDLPILFISGYTSLKSLGVGQLAQWEAFLRKPFVGAELLAAVERLLERAGR